MALIIDVVGLAKQTGIIAKKQLLSENAVNSQEESRRSPNNFTL
ncbi:hypothetical protein [Nostoc commune]|nr:hypothetical protein [Nostoc commune]